VFNLGHGVIKDTNPDNVTLLIKTIRDFKKG
jgi:uroporphyrinogen-III decarboxylase